MLALQFSKNASVDNITVHGSTILFGEKSTLCTGLCHEQLAYIM